MKRSAAAVLGVAVLTALISGIVYFRFPSIMGAHALSIALWGVWSATAVNFIAR